MEQTKRTRRFIRSPQPPKMRLTDRDVEIIRHVHKHRFLRSSHLISLLVGSAQPILRRLQLLYHNGYLDRPRAQIDYYHQGGSRTMVYALGNRGMHLLQRELGALRPRPDWTANNRSIKPLFLQHTLLVADVMVALEIACRNNDRVRLIEPHEIARQVQSNETTPPFRWHVDVNNGSETNRLGIIPDKVFGLRFAHQPPGKDTAYFFLEADRATMPVFRRNLQQTSFFQKMLAYYETWRQRLHSAVFHMHRFRVLSVTTSPQRAQHILAASRSLNNGQGSGLFLVTDAPSLSTHTDLLTFPFQTSRTNERVRLIDG